MPIIMRWIRPATLPLAAAGALFLGVPRLEARPPRGFAVASESSDATRAALRELEAGGNAVDAAVTAALVAGVSSPSSSGIGGGGFALVFMAAEKKVRFFDFREMAPARLDVLAFEKRPLPPEERGKLVGVPGEVAGLHALQQAFGRHRWREVTLPAVRLARDGFSVGPHLGRALRAKGRFASGDAELRSLFWPGGSPLRAGRRLVNPALARTLERVADEGPGAIYQGPIAREMVTTAQSRGGALAESDLDRYRVVERAPLCARWEGHDVCTAPPPSAGGLMLFEVLGEFTRDELRAFDPAGGAYQHLIAEAMRGAVADRMRFVGDPDHVSVGLPALLRPSRLAARRAQIDPRKSRTPVDFALPGGGTHHLVTADAGGNVVSLTTTVNHAFGAELMAVPSGIVLNDELDDFTSARDAMAFGAGKGPNRPQPGARPVSSMTPTLVLEQGRVVLALGGSGGATIATNVTQTVLRRLVFGMSPGEAVRAPRFYLGSGGATIWLERGTPRALWRDLEGRGESVALVPFTESAVQLIARDGPNWRAAADPRKLGTASSE
jgi:gamma-glutamyltranspeptidase / glutathione hydrolase